MNTNKVMVSLLHITMKRFLQELFFFWGRTTLVRRVVLRFLPASSGSCLMRQPAFLLGLQAMHTPVAPSPPLHREQRGMVMKVALTLQMPREHLGTWSEPRFVSAVLGRLMSLTVSPCSSTRGS